MSGGPPVCVVTGANKGIGLAVAEQLAAREFQVVMTARDAGRGRAAADSLAHMPVAPVFHALDVTDQASAEAFAAWVRARYGRVDVLVNNAGIALDKWRPAVELDLDTMRATMETNVYGAVRVIQVLVPLLRRSGSARVINMSSVLGSLDSMSGMTLAYRLSKTALNAVTRVFADELRGDGISVNSMCPGWVKTDLGGDDAPGTVAEAADTCVWLATLGENGPTGEFFKDRQPLAW